MTSELEMLENVSTYLGYIQFKLKQLIYLLLFFFFFSFFFFEDTFLKWKVMLKFI